MSEQRPPQPTIAAVESEVMQRRTSWRDRAGKAGAGVAVAAGAVKFGKALWLAKGLAFLVHFKTAFSMLVSVGVYAIFFG